MFGKASCQHSKSLSRFYILIAASCIFLLLINKHSDTQPWVNEKVETKSDHQKPLPAAFPGTLNCAVHGGPSNELAAEMVYWSDYPTDKLFTSPFYSNNTRKYLTFEPDHAGFNNMRMAFENIILLAHTMGRTLVLPPSRAVYWLNAQFRLDDVYDLERISSQHAGLDIMTTEQFLKSEGLSGNLKDRYTGEVVFPPEDNRTDWERIELRSLRSYLKSTGFVPTTWQAGECLAAFPNGTGDGYLNYMRYCLRNATNNFAGPDPTVPEYYNNPRLVNSSTEVRIREAIMGGHGGVIRRLCLYDENMMKQNIIHFPCCKKEERLIIHHYHFLFYMDWKHDLWTKRFIRDSLRYRDNIQCAAARVVNAIRERARNRDANNINGEYDSFHIRRGDLIKQYKNTANSAEEIEQNSRGEMRKNGTVFVATDEQDHSFFGNLASNYDLVFLDDFKRELAGVDSMYYGMIDQLVASRGRVFFGEQGSPHIISCSLINSLPPTSESLLGCFQSTFSNYIFRLRAWRSQKEKLKGYQNGTLDNSFYYIMPNLTYAYRNYTAMSHLGYMREWPIAWKNMDMGVNELLCCETRLEHYCSLKQRRNLC